MSALVLSSALWISPSVAHAQGTSASTADEPDLVVLKHGGQIRGKVTEMLAGDHATVAMTGGQNAIIRWDEIGSISRGGVAVKLPDASASVAQAPAASAAAQPRPAPKILGPERLDYDSDEPIPNGYHVEKHYRLGLLITGAILTGVGLLGMIAYDAQDGVTSSDRVAFDVVFGTLFLGPGLPLFIVGLAAPRKELVRDDMSLIQPLYDLAGVRKKAPPVFVGVNLPVRHTQAEERPSIQTGVPTPAHAALSLGFRF